MKLVQRIRALIADHKVDLLLFGLSGACAFAADYSTLLFVDRFSHNLLIATTAGIVAGFIISFTLNQLRFSKRHKEARRITESLPLFIGLFLWNTGFTYLCLEINEKHNLLPRILVKMGTVGCIMVWNYILFHVFVFRHQQDSRRNLEGE